MMTHPRGDVRLTINGEEKTLRLTLGALADIEERLGGNFEALAERLKNPRVADLIFLLHALLGGGGTPLTIEALKASDIDLAEAARAIGDAFKALGSNEGDDQEEAPGKPQAPGATSSPESLGAAPTNGASGLGSP